MLSDLLSEFKMNLVALQDIATDFLIKVGVLFLIIVLFWLLGRGTTEFVKFLIYRFLPPNYTANICENLINPIGRAFTWVGTLSLIALSQSLRLLEAYPHLYAVLKAILDFALIGSVAWLSSRLLRQFMRVYGIELIRRLGQGVNELLLVLETVLNVVIWMAAVMIAAQSRDVNVVGLVAGFGLGGLAVAFAAQRTLEQLLGTVVLYLDAPFSPGDYIRLPKDNFFGRVESIGLRSTKIRTAGKNTLLIVPNSILANLEIENVTRGKKIMVLLYLDFQANLGEREQALVQQVVVQCTDTLYGIDPGSTDIAFLENTDRQILRARVTFFILGSTENSIQLRKRLLELANETIAMELQTYGIRIAEMQDPAVYIESPVTL